MTLIEQLEYEVMKLIEIEQKARLLAKRYADSIAKPSSRRTNHDQ